MLSRQEKIVYLFTVGVFAAQFIDIFFIHSENSMFSDNFVARIIGIGLGIVAAKLLDFSLTQNCFKSFGWFFETLYGFAFAIVPIAICFVLEFLYFKSRGYSDLILSFVTPNYFYFSENKHNIISIVVYSVALLVSVLFKELYFRGFIITQLSPKYDIYKANAIQALLYSALSIPYILYSFISGTYNGFSLLMIVYISLAYIVNNFLCGLKWGFFYKVNGSLWMSIADHFANNFILTCFFISSDRPPEKWFILEVFAVQIFSCLMFIPFYIYRDKANIMLAEEVEIGLEVLRAGGDLYTPEEEKKLLPSEDLSTDSKPSDSSHEYFDGLVDSYLHTDIVDLRNAKTLEEPLSVDEVDKKPSEEEMIKSVHAFNPIEPDLPSIDDVSQSKGEDPSELAKEYYDTVINESVPDTKDDQTNEKDEKKKNDEDSSNADVISKLVQNFFDNQIGKE